MDLAYKRQVLSHHVDLPIPPDWVVWAWAGLHDVIWTRAGRLVQGCTDWGFPLGWAVLGLMDWGGMFGIGFYG